MWYDGSGDEKYGAALYQTRFGAFFEFAFQEGGRFVEGTESLTPLTSDQAREWLERAASDRPDLIETLFGEMPEAGSGEVKYTLRMPESLRNRLNEKSNENKQSLNAWIIRCLERCAAPDNSTNL